MATSMVSLPPKTWTLVSTVAVIFQLPDQKSAYAIEATSLPTDETIRQRITPTEKYSFQKLDGNLYMYNPHDGAIAVAIDPVA